MLFNTRYQPLLSDEFFNELTAAFKPNNTAHSTSSTPAVSYEISEFDDKFQLELDLPGLAKSDVTIDLNENLLVISGERKSKTTESAHAQAPAQESEVDQDFSRDNALAEDSEHCTSDSPVVRSTRRYGHFQNSFKLPDTVDKDTIAAQMANGVLVLTLPKRAKKETRISIEG